MIYEANDIDHRLTKPNRPWTNGRVERMNHTIKDATVKRLHYESRDQLRTHFADFMAAYNFARRLKKLSGIAPHDYIVNSWTSDPDRLIFNKIYKIDGLNTVDCANRPVFLTIDRCDIWTSTTFSACIFS